VEADKALHYGIVAAVVPDSDLSELALAKAREIAQWPVNSLREIKRSLRLHHLPAIDAAIKAEQAGMMRQAGSPENIEAVTAFMERRAPDFSKL
jgi:enoyl-CoA hydratase/carnithine racemase